jgi:hypothetical protein
MKNTKQLMYVVLLIHAFIFVFDGRKNDIGWKKENQGLQKLELVFVTN